MLNMLTADILSLFIPGVLDEVVRLPIISSKNLGGNPNPGRIRLMSFLVMTSPAFKLRTK